MKFVKLGLISIVFLFLLLTAISTLLPSSVNIVRSVDINAALGAVHGNINNLGNWKNWYADYDSSKVSFSAKRVGKGASMNVNNTAISIVETSPNEIQVLWQSPKGEQFQGAFNFMKKETDWIVTLQWRFNYQVRWYPWEKFSSVFIDKAIGPFMEKSLNNLKQELEKPE